MQLQQGKSAVEERLEVEKYQAENPQPLPPVYETPQDPIEAQIRGLSPASQQWIRANPYVLTDPVAKNAMTGAHYMAVARNIPLDSHEYFSFIESEIANSSGNAPQPASQARSQRPSVTAAPVSRSAGPNVRSNGSMTITLTPAQREAARDMDMTDEEYAANLAYFINKGEIRG